MRNGQLVVSAPSPYGNLPAVPEEFAIRRTVEHTRYAPARAAFTFCEPVGIPTAVEHKLKRQRIASI